ncbi:hypothetical protein GCM10010919_25790 [Alishewanella longhuensis]|uniref:Integron gene cassette protein n=1 Tax=Alishewanella longhuensis TaxID=1091037 RepID=A0ABQ3L0F3_9ALTE|nr:hypothetical protein [Alishewanella longhuensis]GHG73180.1 hypothetical protein GCM10010919_25790 [Alishewanella longhuensis]
MVVEHKCDKLPKGAYVFKAQVSSSSKIAWLLHLIREATEEDLEENHYLNEVGEDIWTVSAEISFCPYCGCNLYNGQLIEANGDFVLYDSSGCKMRKC